MAPTKVLVSSGVMTTAAKVLTVVIMTLSATSALARKVTTLLAVPPGQLATKQILQGSRQSFQSGGGWHACTEGGGGGLRGGELACLQD